MNHLDYKLSFEEGRVLGVLIEKKHTTPDQYPLSVNSCMLGCNQKTNRNPVTNISEGEVQAAIDNMSLRNIVVRSHQAGSRVEKFDEALGIVLDIETEMVILLSFLLLRGAQTPGELSSKAKRAMPEVDINRIDEMLRDLSAAEVPLVQRLERQPGQKEVRWIQLLTEGAEATAPADEPLAPPVSADDNEGRIVELENEVAELREEIDLLKERIGRLERALGED